MKFIIGGKQGVPGPPGDNISRANLVSTLKDVLVVDADGNFVFDADGDVVFAGESSNE